MTLVLLACAAKRIDAVEMRLAAIESGGAGVVREERR